MKIDDPITFVREFSLVLTTVGLLTDDGGISGCDANTMWERLEDEGKTWLRGYFLPDAPEVAAARAAQALDNSSRRAIKGYTTGVR